jgi:hypothetical protein
MYLAVKVSDKIVYPIQNDMLSWLMDKAHGEETSVRNIALRILAIYLAAIHTMTTVRVVFISLRCY